MFFFASSFGVASSVSLALHASRMNPLGGRTRLSLSLLVYTTWPAAERFFTISGESASQVLRGRAHYTKKRWGAVYIRTRYRRGRCERNIEAKYRDFGPRISESEREREAEIHRIVGNFFIHPVRAFILAFFMLLFHAGFFIPLPWARMMRSRRLYRATCTILRGHRSLFGVFSPQNTTTCMGTRCARAHLVMRKLSLSLSRIYVFLTIFVWCV